MAEAGKDVFSCRIGDQWVGLPIESVIEVVPPQARTEIPLAPPAVLGLINLRGRVITELDSHRIAELPPGGEDAPRHIVIIESISGELFGLRVDEIGAVASVDMRQYEKTPDSLAPAWKNMGSGVVKREHDVLLLVDVEKMLAMSMPPEARQADAPSPGATLH